ncbi:hypothetical protein [Celeribacter indicus]|uniref:Uncharacterized protein n=1 Tax=Celeribacter indicus TaxID=1208324 RepID=A0A0B5E3A4_9RHOB|nr:hypothetical protein [Celeribacter indicus]AJE46917.1 hypothetical protein P73_2202 [Celeribacter indicus]SDW78686.1 hypothetical protein SAMN05443573_10758 [Celeribacter indicus]
MKRATPLKIAALLAGIALIPPALPATAQQSPVLGIAQPVILNVREDGYSVHLVRVNKFAREMTIIATNSKYERHVTVDSATGEVVRDELFPLGHSLDMAAIAAGGSGYGTGGGGTGAGGTPGTGTPGSTPGGGTPGGGTGTPGGGTPGGGTGTPGGGSLLSADVDANVGGGRGIDADVDANVGGRRGVGANVDANVGGRRGIGANVDANVGGRGGLGADVDANVGGGRGLDVSVGLGRD